LFKNEDISNSTNDNTFCNKLDQNLVNNKQMKNYVILLLSQNEDLDETSSSNFNNSNLIANLLQKINFNLQNIRQKNNELNLTINNNNLNNVNNSTFNDDILNNINKNCYDNQENNYSFFFENDNNFLNNDFMKLE